MNISNSFANSTKNGIKNIANKVKSVVETAQLLHLKHRDEIEIFAEIVTLQFLSKIEEQFLVKASKGLSKIALFQK